MKKDMRDLLRQAAQQGCTVARTRNGHHQVRLPNGAIIIVANSPSDHRADKNIRAMLRRGGITV